MPSPAPPTLVPANLQAIGPPQHTPQTPHVTAVAAATNHPSPSPQDPPPTPGTAALRDARLDDLAEIITAYNAVTEKLQNSHATLQDEVLRLRRELTSANAQIQRQQRLSALGEMAAGIAHEIRNPLAAIRLYAEMSVDDLDRPVPDAATALDAARKIVNVADAMGGIVNDVLSFARGLNPHPRLRLAGELFHKALEANRPLLDQHQVTVHLQGQQHSVYADPDMLQQALVNLIRNAAEAVAHVNELPGHSSQPAADSSTSAARPRHITLTAQPDDAGVTLSVTDTGPGLSKDAEQRIFNPFFTTRSTGTGLGLAIVHRIADAHGGAIAVHHHPDHGGAVFTLLLPDPAPDSHTPPPHPVAADAQPLEHAV